MSSYNNIEKIKYSSEDCVVNLQEYIIFENERAEEKFVVFKFTNNVNQQLLGLEFEVSQYDAENNLVEKSVALYNKFLAKPCQPFVPNAKLKVNYACKTLSVRLIQASFDRFIWKEGQFLDNSYKFEHYAEDEDTEAAKRNPPARPVKVKAEKPARAPKKRKGKLPFKAKNATRKNIAKFPAIFNAFVCLVVVAAILFAVFHFNKTSEAFTIDNFDVRITDKEEKTVTVIGYGGEGKDVTVPAQIKDYTVTRIGENAFKDSQIQSVKFNSTKLYIESRAFSGCDSLKTVTSSAEMTVHGYAFENCTALRTVSLPGAALLKNSLIGCTGVTSLAYGSLGADTLEEVFGGKLPKNLTIVDGTDKPDDGDPSDGGDEDDGNGGKPSDGGDEDGDEGDEGEGGNGGEGGTGDTSIAYGDPKNYEKDGYEENAYYGAANGVLITVNPEITELTLPTDITQIDENAYSQLGNIKTLTVDKDSVLTSEAVKGFSSIEEVVIQSHDYESEKVDLSNFGRLDSLTIPFYKDATLIEQYGLPGVVYFLKVVPSGTPAIPDGAFNNITAIEIMVEAGFTSCGKNIVNHSYIEKLTLPKGIIYEEEVGVIGSSCTNLETLDIYLENCGVAYTDINQAYRHTTNLTIRMDTVPERNGGDGYLNSAYRIIKELSIFANDSYVKLIDFVCYGTITNEENYPNVTFNIPGIQNDEDQYNWFVEGYPESKIQNS